MPVTETSAFHNGHTEACPKSNALFFFFLSIFSDFFLLLIMMAAATRQVSSKHCNIAKPSSSRYDMTDDTGYTEENELQNQVFIGCGEGWGGPL